MVRSTAVSPDVVNASTSRPAGPIPCSSGDFIACARTNPINAALLDRLPTLGLNDCLLTAGCLFQAVWNARCGRPPEWGVKDYDVFYFDGADLSWEAEDAVIRRVTTHCSDLGVAVEVRNQARVHVWYRQRFGVSYPQLTSSRDGVDRYLVACTCVAIDVASGALYAPDGLGDLSAGLLRINPNNPQPRLFREKASAYRSRWPWLSIIEE